MKQKNCWFNSHFVAKCVQNVCKYYRLLFSWLSAFLKAIDHSDWTILSGIKSKFNLGGKTGLFQAVRLDPQAVRKKNFLRFVKYRFKKSQTISAL